MVTGYNLRLNRNASEFQDYVKKGERHLDVQKANMKECLQRYIIDGIADGTRIEKEWFPQIEADIFISHSHADERLAKGLAGWIYDSFGLKCFIDSCVWGYADDLLDMINDDYSDRQIKPDGGCVYDHKKCNTASKHVNALLTIALYKMIDKAEVTFLLNTDNSIAKYGEVYLQATYSPWIYSEIVCTEIVRRKPIAEYRNKLYLEHCFAKSGSRNDGFSAAYSVSLEHLKQIDTACLSEWKKIYDGQNMAHALDCLYKYTHEGETRNIFSDVLFS